MDACDVASGLFGRACRSLDNNDKLDKVLAEMRELKKVLTDKLLYILQAEEGTSNLQVVAQTEGLNP